jgi:putative transposase
MSTVLRIGTESKNQTALPEGEALDTRIALIQALIPLGLQAVEEMLQQEVQALAGPRYARADGAPHVMRWGRQQGSVYLADQKLPIQVPRVRNRQAGIEVPLYSYTRFQQPRAADESVLRRILYGLSCRDYRVAAEAVPEAFGLSRSSVSRRYIRATARKLAALQERRLDRYDVVALVLDGKRFAEDTMVIALGITLRGEKVLLGFVQTGTENADVCATFLRSLLDRGLGVTDGLLVVIDGGKGLRRAVNDVFGEQALVQRCVWHKRENVVDHLPKRLQTAWRAKLQQAYRRPTYETAYAELHRLHGELRRLNEDAAKSLAEGLVETLTLHRLGLADRLGTHLSTTNGLESILALVEQRVGKVDRWTTSDQKQRWLATTLLEIEPRLRRLRGYRALPQLRIALQQDLTQGKEVMVA